MSTVFIKLNMELSGGKCPTDGCIGEIAAAFPTENTDGSIQWMGCLAIWDDDFNDSEKLANWIHEGGGRDVWIQAILYSDRNDDRNGRCPINKSRPWIALWTEDAS